MWYTLARAHSHVRAFRKEPARIWIGGEVERAHAHVLTGRDSGRHQVSTRVSPLCFGRGFCVVICDNISMFSYLAIVPIRGEGFAALSDDARTCLLCKDRIPRSCRPPVGREARCIILWSCSCRRHWATQAKASPALQSQLESGCSVKVSEATRGDDPTNQTLIGGDRSFHT